MDKDILLILMLSFVMFATGTLNAISNKLQNFYGFNHGFTMTLPMFLGEYLNYWALLIPLIYSLSARSSHFSQIHKDSIKDKKDTKVSIYRLGFGGFLDVFGSGLQTVSILLMNVSIWQMLRNGVAIFVVIFTIFYLKKSIPMHNWLGVGVVTVGFLFVGAASFIQDPETPKLHDGNDSFWNTLIGLGFLLVSLAFSGFQFTYQEKLMENYEFDPRRLVGAESVVGTVSIAVLLMITSIIPCSNPKMCDVTFDNPATGMMQMINNGKILMWAVIAMFSVMLYNLAGLWLTKKVGSVFRIVMDSARTVAIWIISVMIGLETFYMKRFFLQIIGFALLVLGNLIFNKIVVVPFFGFDRDIKLQDYEPAEQKI